MIRSPWLRNFIVARRGAAAVEFAFIGPVMILMAGGVYECGGIFQSLTAANRLASQYAIAWADCSDSPVGSCNTELGLYDSASAIQNLAPQLTGAVTLQMYQVAKSGTTLTVTYAYPSSAGLNTAQTAAANAVLASGQSGVVVTVNYTYTLSIFSGVLSGMLPASIPMSYTVAQLKA
jgi:Flp pilus assembly protein TadG